MANFSDIEPLQVDESISEEAKEKTTLWIHSNVIKLGKKFGAAFEGCEEITYELFLRIDQKEGWNKIKRGRRSMKVSKQ